MRGKLTKRSVEAVAPLLREQFLWDTDLPGFGVKITPAGKRVYVFQYALRRRTRRVTLGRHGPITVDEARTQARQLSGAVARGQDPAAALAAERKALTLDELADRYLDEHAEAKKKASSVAEDRRNLDRHIRPALGRRRINDVSRADIQRWHAGMRATPGAANRCLALLSKIFNLAEKWGLRLEGTNPCRHVERYPENRRQRFLGIAELGRLAAVLTRAEKYRVGPPGMAKGKHRRKAPKDGEDQALLATIRLLLFTGCRRNEILTLKWEHVDLEHRCLRLPDSKTGAKTVPLGAPARALLAEIERRDDNPYVLPGRRRGQHFVGVEKGWQRIRAAAELGDVRLHDLRHTFASTAVGMGDSLPMIGALLGHAGPATTSRYAHLAQDPLLAAADRIAGRIDAVMRSEPGAVVPIAGFRKPG